jgi:pyrimidine operon attenuation protein/uracil phosphoribosyltransferase
MAEISDLKKLSALSIKGIEDRPPGTNLDEISNSFYRTDEERHNHSTISLHQASESGDLTEVKNILAEGKADLNALIAGHRALRTALHKASAYGHTNVVKLLLKVISIHVWITLGLGLDYCQD